MLDLPLNSTALSFKFCVTTKTRHCLVRYVIMYDNTTIGIKTLFFASDSISVKFKKKLSRVCVLPDFSLYIYAFHRDPFSGLDNKP